MSEKNLNYHIEGTAALKPESRNAHEQACIISFDAVRTQHEYAEPHTSLVNTCKAKLSHDPLLGSMKNARKNVYSLSRADQSFFVKSFVYIVLFGLVVILIGS